MTTQVCYLCKRIDPQEFYADLRKIGFDAEQARKTAAMIEEVYQKDPYVCCGKPTVNLKAAFAYLGAIRFGLLPSKSQKEFAIHFNVCEASVRLNYRKLALALGVAREGKRKDRLIFVP